MRDLTAVTPNAPALLLKTVTSPRFLVPAGGYAKSLTLSAEVASDIRNQAVCRHKRSSREKIAARM